jgi:hypothetical protein
MIPRDLKSEHKPEDTEIQPKDLPADKLQRLKRMKLDTAEFFIRRERNSWKRLTSCRYSLSKQRNLTHLETTLLLDFLSAEDTAVGADNQ